MTLEEFCSSFSNFDHNNKAERQYTCSICGVTTAQMKANQEAEIFNDASRGYNSFHTAKMNDEDYVVCNHCYNNLNTYTLKAISGEFGKRSVKITIKEHLDMCRKLGIAKRIANATILSTKMKIDHMVKHNIDKLSLDNWESLVKPIINKVQINEHCYIDCLKINSKEAKLFIKALNININPLMDEDRSYLLIASSPTNVKERPYEGEFALLYLSPGNINSID